MSLPRSDSKLKRLPIAVICELVRQLQTPGVTQADALAWLKRAHGVSSSAGALSEAYTYLVCRARAHEREQKIEAWMAGEKLEHPELSDEELFRRGQRKFTMLAIAEEDPRSWAMIQKTQRDREQLSLDRDKFEEMKRQAAKADATEKVLGDAALTPEQRAQRIREIYGR